MRKTFALVGWLMIAVFSVVTGPLSSSLNAQQRATTKTCTLKMTGMTCAGCTTAVKLAAKKIDGVKDATVSYEKSTAEIIYDPAKTTPDAIAKAVTTQSGFKAEVQKGPKS
jgi:mercuric ion binding protein